MGCLIAGIACILVITLIASLTGVGLLIAMATKAETALEAAPLMIEEFINANADQFIAEHITRVMPEIVQNAVLALMMGEMNGASTTGSVDGGGSTAGSGSATGSAAALDAMLPSGDRHPYHRSISDGNCGVTSPALCQAFKQTCADYQTCRNVRTSPACMPFVNDMAYVCSINRCDVYTNRATCDRVNNLCINRRAALINPRARAFMEQELVDLCAIVA